MDPQTAKREIRKVSQRYEEIMARAARELSIMEERNNVLRTDIDSKMVVQRPNGKPLPGIIPPTE